MKSGTISSEIPNLYKIGFIGIINISSAPVLLKSPIDTVIANIYGNILYITFNPFIAPSINNLNTSCFSFVPIKIIQSTITGIIADIKKFILLTSFFYLVFLYLLFQQSMITLLLSKPVLLCYLD